MTKQEVRVFLCDICKERPMIKIMEIARYWKGVCAECEKKILKERIK